MQYGTGKTDRKNGAEEKPWYIYAIGSFFSIYNNLIYLKGSTIDQWQKEV